MLFTYTNTSQTVAQNSAIAFNTNSIQTGCTATHNTNSTSISLNKPGIYMVSFNSDAVAAGTAGNITVQLFGNGTLIAGAESTAYSGATTDIMNPNFTALVRVTPNCCCASTGNVPYVLTFVNTGVEATFSNVAVTVTKVA